MSSREILLSKQGGFHEVQVIDSSRPFDLLIKTYDIPEPLLERARNISEQTPDKDMRHVAVIPLSVLDQSFREGWFRDKKRWKAWANDSANANLRTWKGRI